MRSEGGGQRRGAAVRAWGGLAAEGGDWPGGVVGEDGQEGCEDRLERRKAERRERREAGEGHGGGAVSLTHLEYSVVEWESRGRRGEK